MEVVAVKKTHGPPPAMVEMARAAVTPKMMKKFHQLLPHLRD